MANIKTKDSKPKTIKTLNKAVVGTKNLKDNIVSTKEKLKDNSNKNNNEENTIDYGSNAITGASSITASTIATQFNKNGKKSFKETRENIIKSKIKIKEFKDKQKAKRLAKDTIKTGKSTTIFKMVLIIYIITNDIINVIIKLIPLKIKFVIVFV